MSTIEPSDLNYPKSPLNLEHEAALIVKRLEENGFDVERAVFRQFLNLFEEMGEFAGAFRRANDMARRTGPLEDVDLEAADVIITMFVTCQVLNIPIMDAINRKLEVIHSRGWREELG
jgi:NTP pyrophosphatase (non-canonical NTP hydrolase)